MKLKHCLLAMLLPLLKVQAQQANTHQTIKGKVIANNHAPIAGATVSLQQGKQTSVTANEGSFSITLSMPTDTLIVSHVSYQTQHIAVNTNTTTLLITLTESVNQMNDVVVSTGYQTIPKERATGSFYKVSDE